MDNHSNICKKQDKISKAFFISVIICFILLALLVFRLFYLQIIRHSVYEEKWNAHNSPVTETTESSAR